MNYKKIFLLYTLAFLVQSSFVFSMEIISDGQEHILPAGKSYEDGIKINKSKVKNEGALLVEVKGDSKDAIWVDSKSNLTLKGSLDKPVTINNIGNHIDNANNTGIRVTGTGTTAVIDTVKINTNGIFNYGILSNDQSTTAIINGKITTENYSGFGVWAKNDAEVTIDKSNILTNGKFSYALRLSNESQIKTMNTNIKTTGINSSAIYTNDDNDKNEENITEITGGSLESIQGDLIRSEGGKIKVIMTNVQQISTGSGYILNVLDNKSGNHGSVTLDITDTKLKGNILSAPEGKASVKLNNSQLTGKTDNATDISIDSNSQWSVTDNSTISETIANHGNIAFENDGKGFRTITTKNYHGDSGKIVFNTHLADDDSFTDKLIVNGDTSGKTLVKVNNVGGKGALTKKGIELIKVTGKSAGEFIQDGRIVAGLYDYSLNKGNQSPENTNNWYLQSRLSPENRQTREPKQIEAPGQTAPKEDSISVPVYRAEAASYASNLHAANTMFNMTLHQRLGDIRYTDISANENKATSMWIRGATNHINSSMSDQQNKSTSNIDTVMIGGDIVDCSSNQDNRYILGIMAGYGKQHTKAHNRYSQYVSEGRVDGYSTGLYATWYQNQKEKTGLYIDTWMNYNWFNNEVNGQGLNKESYKSQGITASLESGYSFKIGEYKLQNEIFNTFWIQPQAQLTWMNVNAKTHTESNGTRVKGNSGNLQSRLGLRAYLYGQDTLNAGKQFYFKPFIETNWIHNSKNFTVKMNGDENYIQGTRNIVELKTGVEMKISNHLHLWGDISQQLGDKNYSNTGGNLGIKYLF